jgi:vanillate O-demethylase ferredoxin subunit
VFIAGGIGVTPFISMIAALERAGAPLELHYAARSPEHFLPVSLRGGKFVRYAGGTSGSRLDVESLLGSLERTADLYVCGPPRLIDAVRHAAAALGWPRERLHIESFGAARQPADRRVVVTLARTGIQCTVDPGVSLLDALLDRGVWIPYECKRGQCATCIAQVLSGDPDHRDVCLTGEQRQHNLCLCVSWSRSSELALNL